MDRRFIITLAGVLKLVQVVPDMKPRTTIKESLLVNMFPHGLHHGRYVDQWVVDGVIIAYHETTR